MTAPRCASADARRQTTRRRLWSLTWTLAVTEWRLRFYGGFLGYCGRSRGRSRCSA